MLTQQKHYTRKELEKQGMQDTGQTFADYCIYKTKATLYLFERIEKGRYKLYHIINDEKLPNTMN